MMKKHGQDAILLCTQEPEKYLRPILNLKQESYINLGAIATEVAVLVKNTEAR
jgi:hypothetical protein